MSIDRSQLFRAAWHYAKAVGKMKGESPRLWFRVGLKVAWGRAKAVIAEQARIAAQAARRAAREDEAEQVQARPMMAQPAPAHPSGLSAGLLAAAARNKRRLGTYCPHVW